MKTRKPHRQNQCAGCCHAFFPSISQNELMLQVNEGIHAAECCIQLASSENPTISRDKLLTKAGEKLDSILYACAKLKNNTDKRQRIAELQTTLASLQKPTLGIAKKTPIEDVNQEMIEAQEKHLSMLRTHRDEIEKYWDEIEKSPLKLKAQLPIEQLSPNDRKALNHLTAQFHIHRSLMKRIEIAENQLKKMQDDFAELNKSSPSTSKTPLFKYISTTDDSQSSDDSTLLSRHSDGTPSPKSR